MLRGKDMIECSECHSKISANNNNSKAVAIAYDKHRSDVSSKARVLNLLLVGGDCIFVGLQHNRDCCHKLLYRMYGVEQERVRHRRLLRKNSVRREDCLEARHKKVGEKSLLSFSAFVQMRHERGFKHWRCSLPKMEHDQKLISRSRACVDLRSDAKAGGKDKNRKIV
ncbi:hypothetical protein NC651_025984 [Populus alba x Populus x berolinensis]|nr:hypothetical protein NC651_025984 [Populus alba x Populus x berolinensis]